MKSLLKFSAYAGIIVAVIIKPLVFGNWSFDITIQWIFVLYLILKAFCHLIDWRYKQ